MFEMVASFVRLLRFRGTTLGTTNTPSKELFANITLPESAARQRVAPILNA
jgi:hypothetical protein